MMLMMWTTIQAYTRWRTYRVEEVGKPRTQLQAEIHRDENFLTSVEIGKVRAKFLSAKFPTLLATLIALYQNATGGILIYPIFKQMEIFRN